MSESNAQRIMLVDDTPSDIKVLIEIFNSFNVNMTVASNGETALRMAETKDLDLILLDIIMPGMDGYEVCEKLKANPTTANVPVIFITGQDNTVEEIRGFRLGAVDYIKKPYNPMIVMQRLIIHLNYAAHIRKLMEKLKAATGEG